MTMSKAEKLSQNRYPTMAEKYAFIDGYEQAQYKKCTTFAGNASLMEIPVTTLQVTWLQRYSVSMKRQTVKSVSITEMFKN